MQIESTEAYEAAWARTAFLQKVYSLLLLGIGVFAATTYLAPKVPFLTSLVEGLYSSFIVAIVVLIGSAIAVRALARKPGIGLVGYLAYAFILGLFLAYPIALQPGTAGTAAVLTLMIFAGLTTYVFVSKKDLSWMGGALYIGVFALFGIGLCAMLFGLHLGTWYSAGGALIFSGFILYDTSRVLHRCRDDEALPAAIELFVDVIMLFWYLLSLMSRD